MDLEIDNIIYNSEISRKNSVFVCIKGADADGHDYAGRAAEHGARAVICSRRPAVPEGVTVVQVEDTRKAMAYMAKVLCGCPAEKLTIIGVTGTKGKTTTVHMITQTLRTAGCPAGMIGTVQIDTGKRVIESSHTTPESVEIQEYLREMADWGCKAAVIEVSSQALMLDRIEGLNFDIAVFTNIEEDHIGPREHNSFEEYVSCKAQLFRRCTAAVINGDDPYSERMLDACSGSVKTYGFKEGNDLQGFNYTDVRLPGKLGVEFQIKGDYNIDLVVPMPGKFTCYNGMAAAAVCSLLGIAPDRIKQALRSMQVPGRQEMFPLKNGGLIIVDYAHNGTALQNLLAALSAYRPDRLTCVFGCGGDRDRNRRFKMSQAACRYADFLVITSDNPRKESPLSIISDIMVEVKRKEVPYTVIVDRREAIRFAVSRCGRGEITVIAGKGHEKGQIIGEKIIHFDDREEVLASIEKVENERDYYRKDRGCHEWKTPERE